MAAAASEACGIKLLAPSEQEVSPRVENKAKEKRAEKPASNQHGRFRSRPGGWVPKRPRG
jgi:hypothetical protein